MLPYECYCRLYYLRESEKERVVNLGNIVRTATAILVNTQLKKEKQITDPAKLWKFGWEKSEKNTATQEVSAENIKHISNLL